MFGQLQDRLSGVFTKLRGKGVLNEDDINAAMREVRIALLEADVALPVAKDFIKQTKEAALGQEVIKSISPGQMVVKIVQDKLTELLGGKTEELNLSTEPPAVILMSGLQGSGKTTSSAKLGLLLKNKQKKKVLLASLDIYRPAAQLQLETLGKQAQIDTVPIIDDEPPEKITKRALKMAKLEGYDVLILDTAGRLHIDEDLISELKNVKKISNPIATLLVADSLTGQDAVQVATHFHDAIGITGLILTRVDGDARGGAALSMKSVTGAPVLFVGVGEKLSEFEQFHPERAASRILDMGDVVSLVEKAAEEIDQEEVKKMEQKIRKGQFDFNDLYKQLSQLQKMGGVGSIMKMIPGMSGLQEKMDQAGIDNNAFKRQQAIIQSMTEKERVNPKLMNGSRKRRIAAGSGMSVQDVNRLLKQFKQMQGMMKKVGKMDRKTLMRQMGNLGNLKG